MFETKELLMTMASPQLVLLSIACLISLSSADGRPLSFGLLFGDVFYFVLCLLLCTDCFALLSFVSSAQRPTWIGLIRFGSV